MKNSNNGLFKALSHPIRREIILILAESQRNIGFTVLQREIAIRTNKKVHVGGIYHHIGLLGDLLVQNPINKSWSLSSKGWEAYNLLVNVKNHQISNQFLKNNKPTDTFFSKILNIIAPPQIFMTVQKSKTMFLGWVLVLMGIIAYLCSRTSLIMVTVFFYDNNTTNDFLISLISIFFSWLFFTIVTLVLVKLITKKKNIKKDDILAVTLFNGLSFLPLCLFPLLLLIKLFRMGTNQALALAILLQLETIILVSRGISIQFFLRMERASMIAMIAVYIMILVGLLIIP